MYLNMYIYVYTYMYIYIHIYLYYIYTVYTIAKFWWIMMSFPIKQMGVHNTFRHTQIIVNSDNVVDKVW